MHTFYDSDLVNEILNVTEFHKDFIILYSEIPFENIVVLCGDNATNLQVCAKQGRVVNNTVYFNTIRWSISETIDLLHCTTMRFTQIQLLSLDSS